MVEVKQRKVKDLWEKIHTQRVLSNCIDYYSKKNRIQNISPWDELERLFFRMIDKFDLCIKNGEDFLPLNFDLLYAEPLLPNASRKPFPNETDTDNVEEFGFLKITAAEHAYKQLEELVEIGGEKLFDYNKMEVELSYSNVEWIYNLKDTQYAEFGLYEPFMYNANYDPHYCVLSASKLNELLNGEKPTESARLYHYIYTIECNDWEMCLPIYRTIPICFSRETFCLDLAGADRLTKFKKSDLYDKYKTLVKTFIGCEIYVDNFLEFQWNRFVRLLNEGDQFDEIEKVFHQGTLLTIEKNSKGGRPSISKVIAILLLDFYPDGNFPSPKRARPVLVPELKKYTDHYNGKTIFHDFDDKTYRRGKTKAEEILNS